jgi:type VI secretion system protein ImpK
MAVRITHQHPPDGAQRSRLPDHPATNAVISSLLHQVTLARAADLARAGHYSEAEPLLSEAVGEDQAMPAALDLLARIRAQQGRLLEAEALWTRACQLDPTNEAYRAGLHRIANMQRRPVWLAFLSPWLVGLVVVGIIIATGLFVRNSLSEWRASFQSELAGITAAQEAITSQRQGKPPDVTLKIPGVSLRTEGDEIIVIFDSGLFARGTALNPEAKALLTELGHELEPYVGRIALRVIGHTDDVPMPAEREYRDNIALSLARAVAVVEQLRATSRLPAVMFSTSGLGERLAPYVNDTPENRARNRTVVIRISGIER